MAQRRRPDTAYERVANDMRQRIQRQEFADGRRLPTEADLAERYGLSRQTVRRAMQDLVLEGLIYRVAGRGTFAMSAHGRYVRHFGSIEDLMALSSDTVMELITPLQRRVDLEAAGRLRLGTDAVMTASFRRFHDGTPFCHTTVHLPPDIGGLLADVGELHEVGCPSTNTVIGLIDEKLGITVAEAEQSVTAVALPATVAAHLDAQAGDAALRIDRLYVDAGLVPLELAVSYFDAPHYSYRLRLRRST